MIHLTALAASPLIAQLSVNSTGLRRAFWSAVILIGGLALARLIAAVSARIAASRGSRQTELITRRLVFYAGAMVAVLATLRYAGVELGVLLGTAGILTVALGFASQTSASNLISGLFLLFERPFVVGDVIRLGTLTGEVLSVDMMSVKLRTFDNLFVRIPNETLLKSDIANISHFPIRRLDVTLMVAYGEDMDAFREALFAVAAENPYVLDEPTPMVIVDAFHESAVAVQFSVWSASRNYLDAKTSVLGDVQRSIYGGRFEPPYAVRRVVEGAAVVAGATKAEPPAEAR